MTNFTAEKFLEEAYCIISEKQSDKHEDIDPVLITAMKAYATQEVTKYLKIASNLCKIKSDGVAICNIEIDLT